MKQENKKSIKKPKVSKLLLFENQNYFVLNKPSGIAVLDDRAPDAVFFLLELAREYHAEAQACHRLDKETSGIIVFAKNQEAYRNMALQFEDRVVAKMYHALCHGRHELREYEIDAPLEHRNGKTKISPAGKESVTIVESALVTKSHTLIECMPLTGRTHQIRAHLAHINAPIVGDEKYGGKPFYLSDVKRNYNLGKYEEERPLLNRTALHALKIRFEDLDGSIINVEAPYPKDILASLKQLHNLKEY